MIIFRRYFMIIDAHHHFWNYESEKHSWIDDSMSAIRRDFLPLELGKVYAENGIDGCVAVQADQTIEENDFLLKLADQYSFIKGIVGWVDFRNASVDADLEKYSQFNKVKGFRHVVQGEADPNFLLRDDFLRGISCLEKHHFVYDILVFPHQLGSVLEFVKRFPKQKFIIDHIAKPYIKDGFFDGWAVLMTAIAEYENVFCKLSGMVTEADYNNWSESQLEPYMQLIMRVFGAKRVLYGSDWPVCLVAADYKRVKKTVENFIMTLSETEQACIMGENAMTCYNL